MSEPEYEIWIAPDNRRIKVYTPAATQARIDELIRRHHRLQPGPVMRIIFKALAAIQRWTR